MRARMINGRRLSTGRPLTEKQDKVTASALSRVLGDFVRSNLRGAMEYECDSEPSGTICISVEHTAYLLRLLLECSSDDTLVRLSMEDREKDILLRAKLTENLPCEEDMLLLSAAAAKAGFCIKAEEGEILFRAQKLTRTVFSLYSVPPNNMYLDFVLVFFYL